MKPNRPGAVLIATALSISILNASEQTRWLVPAASKHVDEVRGDVATIPWTELGREIQPYWTLRMVLPDGTTVQGSSARFDNHGLTMLVQKSTRTELHPKSVMFIPREQVKVLDIRTNQPIGRAVDRRFRHLQVIP